MDSTLTVGLAQIDARLGDVEANLERHLDWIERARERGVQLLVFPELSLTGYRLLHLTPQVAIDPAASPVFNRLAEAARDMTLIVGFVEAMQSGVLHNSAAVLADGGVQVIQRKLHLPTYGIFQEGRFFAPGKRLERFRYDGERAGILICEDLWHPAAGRRLARAGARVLVVLSAAPGRLGAGEVPASHETWEALTRATAILDTSWVLYCNRVGFEEGSFYTGGSHVVAPDGCVVERAPFLDEHLLVATIDLFEVDRVRQRLPLLTTERHDIEGPE
jgi:predicted amidohydrolase